MQINFTDKEIEDCENFSQSVDTSFYSTRNQNNNDKRKLDSKIGKLGEIAAYNFLKTKYKDITYPDFKIYKAKEKSWAFDMTAKDMNIHVKAQDISQGKRFGESWLFQAGDGRRGYDKEIFDKISPNQYVVFVTVDLKNKCAYVKAVVDLNLLHDKKLFKLPVVPLLQQMNKVAVYYKDLESFKDNFIKI